MKPGMMRLFNQDDIPPAFGEQCRYRRASRAAADHQDVTSDFAGYISLEAV
jgi:hypothetical protein